MLVIIRGNACSGKSTIAEFLRGYFKGKKTAVIHTSAFYWEIVKGDSTKMAMESTKLVLDNYLKNGYHVILEGTLSKKNKNNTLYVSDFERLAKRYKIPTRQFFFTADLKELKTREKARKKISIQRLKEFYDMTNKTIRNEEVIIDTTNKSIKQVTNEVKKRLK